MSGSRDRFGQIKIEGSTHATDININCKTNKRQCLNFLYDTLKPGKTDEEKTNREKMANMVYLSFHGEPNLRAPGDGSFILPNNVVVILLTKCNMSAVTDKYTEEAIPYIFKEGLFFVKKGEVDKYYTDPRYQNSIFPNMKLFLPGDRCHSYMLHLELTNKYYDFEKIFLILVSISN